MSFDLIDELRACLDSEDGRTLIEMREAEPHYTVTVESAEYNGKGSTVTCEGLTTYLAGREVKTGDEITYWDGNAALYLGSLRHGWAHNGELVEWLTPYERIAKRVAGLAEHDRRNRERLERGAEKRAKDYAALPEPLRVRIDRFVAARSDFWINSGDYELFCCTEAVKIAEHLRPLVEAGREPGEFHDLPWDKQVAAGVSDGHSGNTFGGACRLASCLLAGHAV